MEREKRGFKDNIIDKLEDARTLHKVARACMVASFLGITAAANTMKPEDFSKVAGLMVGWLFFTAVVDTITSPGAIRNIEERIK